MSTYDQQLEDDALEDGGPGGPRLPTVKLRTPGDKVVGMLVDYDAEAPLYKFGTTTKELERKEDGTPYTKDVLTLMILDGSSCAVTLPREPGQARAAEVVAQPGTVARLHVQKHNRYSTDRDRPGPAWRNAKDELGRVLHIGDVVACLFYEATRQGADGRELSVDKRVLVFGVRPPEPGEAPLVEQARRERAELKAGRTAPASSSTPASPPSAAPVSASPSSADATMPRPAVKLF